MRAFAAWTTLSVLLASRCAVVAPFQSSSRVKTAPSRTRVVALKMIPDPAMFESIGEGAVAKEVAKRTIKFITAGFQTLWDDGDGEVRGRFVSAMCTVPELDPLVAATYVERPAPVRRIKAHVDRCIPVSYLNVVGCRGGGKSCVVVETLRGRDGVVYVQLRIEFPTINAVLKHKLGIEEHDKFTNEDIFENFEGEHKPVLVVEIDSNADGDTVREQSQELKTLCGRRLVHGILVLSDAGAAFKLNPDPGRQDFLWVGDFARDEALAFLDKRGALPTDGEPADGPNSKLRRRLLDEAGANPQFLLRTTEVAKEAVVEAAALLPAGTSEADKTEAWRATERGAFEAFIREQLVDAVEEVRLSLIEIPETKRIMRALIDSPAGTVYPSNVRTSGKTVMAKLKGKDYHAITYNRETKMFEFFSPPHEMAARAEERKRKRQQFFGLRGFFMK